MDLQDILEKSIDKINNVKFFNDNDFQIEFEQPFCN